MKLKILFVLILMIVPAYAQANECEKLAKDYQREHGGELILVQPLKENGAYDLGEYSGHWMNKVWDKVDGNYYYDPQDMSYYLSKHTVEVYFNELWNKDVVVLDYNKGEVPFDIIWHF